MRFLTSLLLLVGLTWVVLVVLEYRVGPDDATTMVDSAMSVGFLMLGAWLAGRLFERVSLPKISGYIVFGVLVGPQALGLVPAAHVLKTDGRAPSLQFASDLAIALIALTAGGEIHLEWVRDKIWRLLAVIGVDVLTIITGGILVIFLLRPVIPFVADETTLTVACIALLVATVMIANSPTVIIAMISDYRASGPMSQMLLAFTVLKDLVLIILFATVTSTVRGLLDEETALTGTFLVAVGVQLVGSILLGAGLGVLMAAYVEYVRAHLMVFIIGACMLFAVIGGHHFVVAGQDVHLEPLLMALSAGLLCQNVWPRRSEPMFHAIEEMSLPVYCLFFDLAGAKIDLGAFASLWHIAIGLAVVRAGLVWAGVTAGFRLAGIREPWTRYIWLGMIPQAGVTLVLILLIGRSFEADFGWGREVSSLLIGMLVLHELVGPIGVRWALVRSGETEEGAGAERGGGH